MQIYEIPSPGYDYEKWTTLQSNNIAFTGHQNLVFVSANIIIIFNIIA